MQVLLLLVASPWLAVWASQLDVQARCASATTEIELHDPGQRTWTTISPQGIEIATENAAAAGLRLRPESWGRGSAQLLLSAAAPRAHCGRIELRRGAVTEWYVRDARGVEQGFTLASPPALGEDDRALRLVLAFDGGFEARVLPGARDACFRRAGDPTIVQYRGLCAWDATGRDLPARLAVEDDRLFLEVEDADATYPVTIDPWLWVEEAELIPLTGGGNAGVLAVALDGDTAVAGSPWAYDSAGTATGTATVFTRTGTTWSREAMLAPSDGVLDDYFAWSVALADDRAVLGAMGQDAAASNAGAAYVFARSGTSWTQEAKLMANDAATIDGFGVAVALDGDTALVGAEAGGGLGLYTGSAYVFVRTGSTWTQQAELWAADGAPWDAFGRSVALSGDTALIGASLHYDVGDASGAAYVFVRSGTVWTQQSKLTPSDADTWLLFGQAVSLTGDTAVVSAYYGDSDPVDRCGAAYVFERTGSTWTEAAKLTAGDASPDDYFGQAVAIAANRIVIGAHGDDDLGSFSGSVYVFENTDAAWTQTAKLLPADGRRDWGFGYSVSASGDSLVAATPQGRRAVAFAFIPVAATTLRNAGSNPVSYAALTLPLLGYTYVGQVDLAGTTGHTLAWLAGFATPATIALGGGQVLLVNPADPAGELLSLPIQSGPRPYYSIPVPADPGLAGFELSTQALHFGGVVPFALSNAQDLFVGI